MIVDIEVVPQPLGTTTDKYAHVEAAIALAQASGLHYEVNALGTTLEGPPDVVWPLLRAMHESCLTVGRGARDHRVQDRRAPRGLGAADDGRAHGEVPHVTSARRRLRAIVPPVVFFVLAAASVGSSTSARVDSRTTCCPRRVRCGARSSTWRPISDRTCGQRSPKPIVRPRRRGRRRGCVRRAHRAVAVRAPGRVSAARRLADDSRDRVRTDPDRVVGLRAAAQDRGRRARRRSSRSS